MAKVSPSPHRLINNYSSCVLFMISHYHLFNSVNLACEFSLPLLQYYGSQTDSHILLTLFFLFFFSLCFLFWFLIAYSSSLYMFGSVEINEEHSNESKQRLFISEPPITRESATITCVWQGFKGRRGSGKALSWNIKGSLQVHSGWELLAWWSWKWTRYKWAIHMIGLENIFDFL